jgi:imidazolonepropionase-like amidohydrolase
MRQDLTRHGLLATVVGLLIGAPPVLVGGQPPAGTTVFEGARLIAGDGQPPIENAAFVVTGDRIVAVGRAGTVKVPQGATRVLLTGKTVMPTIVDTHTHLSQTREALTDDLRRRAYYGVSAAMSLGQDAGDLPFEMRAKTLPGHARFFTAGRGITMPEPGRSDVPYWINNADEGRKAIQELAARKVDIVKIWVDDRDGKYKKLTPDLYGPIIEEAHKRGLRVTAHIFALEDAKGLLKAGIDAFAHGVRDRDLDDDGLALFKSRSNVVVVPNLPDRGVKTDPSWLRDSLSEGEFKKLQAGAIDRPALQAPFGIQARNLAKLSGAGVRIALGTDGNTPWGAHLEMADMVASGMTPMQVIVASTRNSAEFLRMNDAGTLAANKSADFIVLDANPLDDITNSRRISSVYLRGAVVDRTAARSAPTGR